MVDGHFISSFSRDMAVLKSRFCSTTGRGSLGYEYGLKLRKCMIRGQDSILDHIQPPISGPATLAVCDMRPT